MNKVMNATTAMSLINNGDTVAIGGNVLHRAPMSLIRHMVRHEKKQLRIVKTAGAHDVDLLVRGNCVYSVDAGFVSYETHYGLATYFRKACQNGDVIMNEHACYTVMSALNAARINVPFMPVHGLQISDLIETNDYFDVIEDPFSKERVTVVKAIVPDVAILHVSACDHHGNCLIDGPNFDDVLMAKAAKKVIVSTEKIVSESQIRLNFQDVAISSILVDAIVEMKRGALPCSHGNLYDVDDKTIVEFLEDQSKEGLERYLTKFSRLDQSSARGKIYG